MFPPVRLFGATLLAAAASSLIAAPPAQPRKRAEIDAAYRWDFAQIYPDWAAWEKGMAEMDARMKEFTTLKGTLSQGPEALLRAYNLYDTIGRLQYLTYRYPQLQRDTDLRNQEISGRFQQVNAAFDAFSTATAWFTPELLTIPEETVRGWIASTPSLEPFRFPILEAFRQRKHVLDEDKERLLALASPALETTRTAFQELSTADIKFPTVTLSEGNSLVLTPGAYQRLLATAEKQEDRRTAYGAFIDAYLASKNTYAALYRGTLQRGWFNAQARGYPSVLAASLDNNNVPVEVYTNLVDTVRAGTAPLQRYMKLRKRILGLDTYYSFDHLVPLVKDDSVWPYEDAKKLVTESVAPFGADYQASYARLLSSGRVDVYENEGKRSGAYSAGVYGVGPFMLMNYNDTLDSVFTLAHEMGHSMHTELSYATQPFSTASYTIFVAEVASTINERFLLEHMLARTEDPVQRFRLLQRTIDEIVGTFYSQVMLADFELRAHSLIERGEPATVDSLSKIYEGLLTDYYGDSVTFPEQAKTAWCRVPHLYNTPFYVYQYATCFASSAQLYKRISEGSPSEREAALARYLTLLRSGGNDHPMEQLRKAGVDLAKPETVRAVVEEMDALVTRLEAEAARLKQ